MSDEKHAAIDLDKAGDRKLNEINAADFLTALNSSGLSVAAYTVWPEKKKIELFLGPENIGGIRVRDLFKGIREKKKVELELPPKHWRSEIYQKLTPEGIPDPRIPDPTLIRQIAVEVAEILKIQH